MHLITGKKGTPHVTSENHGFLNSRMVGRGRFVFNFSHNFEAVKLSNNSVQIRSGQGMLNGRHFEIEEGQTESVSIDSGTVGMNRNDIIVARYEKAQNGYESMTLVAVKGTAVSGTPSDPSITDGNILNGDSVVDFPMYRVKIVDTDIDSIEQMFTVVDFDIAEMQEAVTETLENVEETLAELEDSLEDVENKPYKFVGHNSNGEPFYVPVTDLEKKVSQGDLYLDNVSNDLWYCYAITKNSSDEVTHADWIKIAKDYRTPHVFETWSAPSTNPSHYQGVEIGDILLRYDEEYTGTVNNVYIAEMVTTLGTPVVNWREIVTDRSEKWDDKLDREDGIKIFYGTTEPTQSLLNGSKSGDIYIRLTGSDREVSLIIGMWLVSVYPSNGNYYWQKIPLGDYYNKTETDNLLNAKQGTLTAGTNITIDANNVIKAKERSWKKVRTIVIDNDNAGQTVDGVTYGNSGDTAERRIHSFSFNTDEDGNSLSDYDITAYYMNGTFKTGSSMTECSTKATDKDGNDRFLTYALGGSNITSDRTIYMGIDIAGSDVSVSPDTVANGYFRNKRFFKKINNFVFQFVGGGTSKGMTDGSNFEIWMYGYWDEEPTRTLAKGTKLEVVEELPTMSKEELKELTLDGTLPEELEGGLLKNVETDVLDSELNEIDESEVEKDVSEIEEETETIEK